MSRKQWSELRPLSCQDIFAVSPHPFLYIMKTKFIHDLFSLINEHNVQDNEKVNITNHYNVKTTHLYS